MLKKKQNKPQKSAEESYLEYQQKAVELEVDEELRQDQLREFWKKYHVLIYVGIFAVLAITAGTEIYRSWWAKVRLSESDLFEKGMVAAYTENADTGIPHFEQLAQSGKTSYRYLAQMELAGLAIRKNEFDKAMSLLKGIMESRAPKSLRFVATLSYVGYQLDTLDPKEALQLLQPLLDDPAFMGTAAQMACALHMKQGENDKARAVVDKALAQPNLDQNVKSKLEALQSMIGSAK